MDYELPEHKTMAVECDESFESTTCGDYDSPAHEVFCGFEGDVEASLDRVGEWYEWTCPLCKSTGYVDADDHRPEAD